ncbi:helix-turn-helix domain-containing protein [Chitinophaga filiformis]|uniref:Helix-turn-helix domain-containing protein n=1 Tax=Chitinophaga filiformis TaxID=104663 RepID=A0A1G7H4W0_CHIFI|nr:AraC family transcriptional regulator [Chitinophaga filiformis]SDE95353.1 Helix-turn-helix domain-containing protein [Chitinophaga filiformis]
MKKASSEIHVFNSVSELMRQLGHTAPLHPLVALINYDNTKVPFADVGEKYSLNFYKISFKTSFRGQVKYGQGYYDFEEGGLAFLAPNQIVTVSGEEQTYEGYALFFHPDLIRNYTLGNAIHKYGFFSYAVSEALFLSDKEKKIIASLFDAIAKELDNNIDHFSQDVLVSQIELLLNYSNRYYNRQFITRKTVYNDLIGKMDAYLSDRLDTRKSPLTGIPSVQELADHLNVSPRYLTDMLKSLTGLSAQQQIHHHLIEKAKHILSHTSLSIAEIAYELGFEHPQSFNKLFRQKTNMTPVEFRQSFA